MTMTLQNSKVARLEMVEIDRLLNFEEGTTAEYVSAIGGIKLVEDSMPFTSARKVLNFHYRGADFKNMNKVEKNLSYSNDMINLASGFKREEERRTLVTMDE